MGTYHAHISVPRLPNSGCFPLEEIGSVEGEEMAEGEEEKRRGRGGEQERKGCLRLGKDRDGEEEKRYLC